MMDRLDVRKTYKLYVGGTFPRSESGRTYEITDTKGRFVANAARASRKDAATRSWRPGPRSRVGRAPRRAHAVLHLKVWSAPVRIAERHRAGELAGGALACRQASG